MGMINGGEEGDTCIVGINRISVLLRGAIWLEEMRLNIMMTTKPVMRMRQPRILLTIRSVLMTIRANRWRLMKKWAYSSRPGQVVSLTASI